MARARLAGLLAWGTRLMRAACWTACFALALASAGACGAAPPISRGEQFLATSHSDCMARAQRAFQVLGWSNIGAGGSFVTALKGIHNAYITCNQGVPGTMIVNIFVASDQGGGDVPGAERVALQAQMERPGAIAGESCSSAVGAWRWFNGLTVTFRSDGVVSDDRGGVGTWRQTSLSRYVLSWDTYHSTDVVDLQPEGVVLNGNFNGQVATAHRVNPCR